MKRYLTIAAILLVLALGGVTVWHFRPWQRPVAGELYLRYEHQPGVRVGFIKDFRINDSTVADVTTIEALDSTGWRWMEKEFAIPALDPRRQELAAAGKRVMQSWQLAGDTTFLFLSYDSRSLCLVQTNDDHQLENIFRYHLQQLAQ